VTETARDAGAVSNQEAGAAPDDSPAAPHHSPALSRFIEDFTFSLIQMGFPRMPARVIVALSITDSGRLTAAELASALQASPAAVSGAVRYLIQLSVISREGEPGSRRHYYRVPDNLWEETIGTRNSLMSRWAAVARGGASILGEDTPAGIRMAETAEYLEFVSSEVPGVIRRWAQHKAALNGRTAPPVRRDDPEEPAAGG
jgi:hypothetical protein